MSEVFAWGEGRVVKLFLATYDYAVERELDCADAVHRAGVASPAVHGIVEVDGRRGIASWLARAASAQHRSEPGSADAADLQALMTRRHHDLVEPVLARLLAH